MKSYSDDEIIQLLDRIPPIVRERITRPETARIIASIGKSKQLHIDKIGKIAELNRNALLGLIGPAEFVQELIASGISDADAKNIVQQINEQIFKPLRDEELKRGIDAEPKPVTPAPAPAPAPASAAPQAPVAQTPAGQTGSFFRLQNKIQPAPGPRAYTPPPQSPMYRRPDQEDSPLIIKVSPPPVVQQKRIVPVSSVPVVPVADKTEVPPNLPGAMPPRPVAPAAPAVPVTPASSAVLPSARIVAPAVPAMPVAPVAPRPGTPAAPVAPRPMQPVMPAAPAAPKPPAPAPAAPAKPYGVDPYREPIEP